MKAGEELGPATQCALKAGIQEQLDHESSEEYVEAAKHKVQEAKTDYFTA